MSDQVILNNRYKLLGRVGTGGMATVYRAEDVLLGRLVAIKMLHEGLAGDELFVRQFQREAHSAANLTHPNIVTVHDIGEYNHRPYIVMEFVAGKTLKNLITEAAEHGQRLPLPVALDLIIQVCQGIGYAHRSGLVHCDVKPHNVLVTADQTVKVADFGIARALSQSSHQQSDMIWGTPQYFSPEQASGEPATPASDVYSIGIMLFEALSGRLPFEGESSTAIALKHLHEPPPAVRDLNPQVPAYLEQILFKVLSKEPAGRYRTAGQLGRILSAYREQLAVPSAEMPKLGEPLRAGGSPPAEDETTAAPPPAVRVAPPPPAVRPNGPNKKETAVPTPLPPTLAQPATDWVATSLALTALVALLGLIPLWYLVYLAWQ